MNEELAKNRAAYKRCTKTYNIVTIAAGIICVPQVIIGLVMMVFDTTFYFFGSSVFKSIVLAGLIYGAYKHEDKLILVSPLVALINVLIVPTSINGAMLFLSAAFTAVIIMTNRKYRELEQQVGFPYFNEMMEERRMDEVQRNIKDEYQQNYERLKKTQSSEMDDI